MTIDERHAALSRPAADWLVAACDPGSGDGRGLSLPPSRDVPNLLRAAELHGVLPFALRRFRRHDEAVATSTTLDGDARQAIERARVLQINQAGMELLLRHHGRRVLAALETAGVAAAIVKGPTFADRLYAEPAMRTFTDIDVLIPLSGRETSRTVLQDLGFELHDRDYREGRDFFEDVWLLATDRRVSIEIHSDLVHNPKLRAHASLSHDGLMSAGAGDTNDATALLFVAATHGAMSHQFDRLQHLVDVSRAASGTGGPIDWQRLRNVCDMTGTRRGVVAALTLAGTMFSNRSLMQAADLLQPSLGDRLSGRLVTPAAVLDARSDRRSAMSWRRKMFRQSLRGGRRAI